MTILQTRPTLSNYSAEPAIERAQTAMIRDKSAPEFSGVLDAFKTSETSETSEEADQEGVESDAEQEPNEPVDGSDSATSNPDEESPTLDRTEFVEKQQVPDEIQGHRSQVNSILDLSKLLHNAAQINLADLATGQLQGEPTSGQRAQELDSGSSNTNNKAGEWPQRQPESGRAVQSNERTPDERAGRFNFNAVRADASGAVSSVDKSFQVKPMESMAQPTVREHGPELQPAQVAQADRVAAAGPTIPIHRHESTRSTNLTGGETGNLRAATDGTGAQRAGGQQPGMDLGDRTKSASRLTQDQSTGDRALLRKQVISQVQRGLASVMNTKGGSMKLRLSPEHLGEVKIQMHTKDGHVRVRIEAGTDEARTMLRDGLEGLHHSMESRGVHVDELKIVGSEDSIFEQIFAKTDQESPDGGSEKDPQDQETAHSGDSGDDPAGADDLDDSQQDGIWTELGLDTIA